MGHGRKKADVWRVARSVLILVLVVVSGAGTSTAHATTFTQDDPVITGPDGTVDYVTGSGWDGDLYTTKAEGLGMPEVDSAAWTAPDLPAGRYSVSVYVPTVRASTVVRYFVGDSTQEHEVRVDQAGAGLAGTWVALGVFAFAGDGSAYVHSTDAGGVQGVDMAWDAIRWASAPAAPSPPDPTSDQFVDDDPVLGGSPLYVDAFAGIGYDNDLIRVRPLGGGAAHTAQWSFTVTTGRFHVEAWIPREHASTVATYSVHHRDGVQDEVVDQSKYNDMWVDLGTFDFAGPTATVTASDAIGSQSEEISWDAVRLTRVAAPPVADPASTSTPPSTVINNNFNPNNTNEQNNGTSPATDTQSTQSQDPVTAASALPVLPRQADDLLFAAPIGPRGRPVAYQLGHIWVRRPPHGQIRFICAPCIFTTKANPARTSTPPYSGNVTRAELLRPGRLLKRGSKLEIRVTRPGYIGRFYRLVFRPGVGRKLPRYDRCLESPSANPKPCAKR